MLSTSMAFDPDPDTHVVMCPPPPGVPITTTSPALTRDCQLPDCPDGPLKATIPSPFDGPGTPIAVLCTGSEAPASAEIALARTQHPFMFHAWPTKPAAAVAIDTGVACAGTVPLNFGCVTTVALPRYPEASTCIMEYALRA